MLTNEIFTSGNIKFSLVNGFAVKANNYVVLKASLLVSKVLTCFEWNAKITLRADS